MSFGEILIVCFGLSLDVFAVTACMGAMLARIRAGRLIVLCLIFSLWQVIAFVLGRLLSALLQPDGVSAVTLGIWRIVSAGIFLALGGLLIGKALKNKVIFEHRSEFPIKKVMAAGAQDGDGEKSHAGYKPPGVQKAEPHAGEEGVDAQQRAGGHGRYVDRAGADQPF